MISVLAVAALTAAGLVVMAAPAGAATTVTTEAAFRAAWSDPNETEIVLGADITLTDCDAGTPSRGGNPHLTLNGNGYTIEQTCTNAGVLENFDGALTIENITLTGGHNSGEEPLTLRGGGLNSWGSVVVRNSVITGNSALVGGGIVAEGGLVLIGSEVSNNTAHWNSAGVHARVNAEITDSVVVDNTSTGFGGGVTVGNGDLKITRSHFEGNRARAGAGANALGFVEVVDSEFRDNTAEWVGGGLVANEGGRVTGTTIEDNSAGVGGGGILALNSLEMTGSVVSGNTSFNGGGIQIGADPELGEPSTTTITSSEVSGNTARTGGGIWSDGAVSIEGSTVATNTADGTIEPAPGIGSDSDLPPLGGGIHGADVSVSDSVINDNDATNDGGGVYATNVATFVRSTISDNTAGVNGGGALAIWGVNATASTISANDAGSHGGGAVAVGAIRLTNSTVAGNTAEKGGGVVSLVHTSLVYSTVVGNIAPDVANVVIPGNYGLASFGSVVASPGGGGQNCGGTSIVNSHGWNVADDATCTFTNAANGDVQNVDPMLGELAANGGPTATMLPAFTSPLVNAVPAASCQANGAAGITSDQRGSVRPSGSGCDIGALEREDGGATVVSDEAAFRAAWGDPDETLIALDADITLTDCDADTPERPWGASSLTLNGGGHTIEQTCENQGVLYNQSGALTLDGLTITGGGDNEENNAKSGGLHTDGGALIVKNSVITGNSAPFGGGLSAEYSPLEVSNSVITGNSALIGGGILGSDGLRVVESEVSDNSAVSSGAGIAASGSVEIVDSSITGNVAGSLGGGVSSFDTHYPVPAAGALTVTRSLIEGNTAWIGAGLWSDGSLDIVDSTIRDNTAEVVGGGFASTTTTTVSGSTVENNAALSNGGGIAIEGSLDISDSVVSGNTAFSGGGIWAAGVEGAPVGDGGGDDAVVIEASVDVAGSEISDNVAHQGGGIWTDGQLTLLESVVNGNTADASVESPSEFTDDAEASGGGIYGHDVSIADSTVNGNTASYDGGGVYATNTATLERSTVSDNTAGHAGGAVAGVWGITATDSTISANSADDLGGGLAAVGAIRLTNSTVTENSAPDAGGVISLFHTSLVYSTVAGNISPAVANVVIPGHYGFRSFGSVIADAGGGGQNCGGVGTTTSKGWNASDDNTCGFDAATDLQDVDPQFGDLADNGGLTQTLLPAATSPLVDAIPLADCQSAGAAGITTDQRGFARPFGSGCDIGAVERELPAEVSYTGHFSEQACTALHTFADAIDQPVEEVVRMGVNGFVGVAEAGNAVPGAPPVGGGPCEITVTWPASEVDRLENAATAWGVDVGQLHHAGGQLILALLWIAIVNSGG